MMRFSKDCQVGSSSEPTDTQDVSSSPPPNLDPDSGPSDPSLTPLHSAFVQLGPYRPCAVYFVGAVVTFTLLRLAMFLSFVALSRLDLAMAGRALWVGFRFDVMVGLCFVLWQTVHLTVVPEQRRLGLFSRGWLEFEWIIASLLLPLLCIAEWLFFDEFRSRLNYIAFEYLVYPTEVCCNIWESYAIVPWLTLAFVVASFPYFFGRPIFLRQVNVAYPFRRRIAVLVSVLAAISSLWLTTGMDSRSVSDDRITIECSGNGLYSFVYYAVTCRFDYDQSYVMLEELDAIDRVRRQVVGVEDRLELNSTNPVERVVTTGRPARDWNVVLILEESLGSNFVGELGDDRGLTPELDQLCDLGILFDQWYATGNRTARALEAVMTSMPPIPTESILKRDHSERVFTLARVLEQRGYERLFMTAGRGIFDGVRSFMTNNGFNHFIEQSDFKDPVFTNAWGVSDDDLFQRGLRALDDLHAVGTPFFAALLTVSNHRPYTYPEGRISETAQSRKNAVKYSDKALGDFFRQAKNHAWYDNTLFVVMGDHGARVYGSQLFPVQSYRVPMLMILPQGDRSGTRCHTLGCSLDIAPTIMSQLGGEYRSVFFGNDVLSASPEHGRALMQHNHDVALLDTNRKLTTLGFNHATWQFDVADESFELRQDRYPDSEKVNDTAALYQTAYRLYYADQWYPDY